MRKLFSLQAQKSCSLFAICFAIFLSQPTMSQAEVRWAADAKSGIPYVFYNPDNMDELVGFEYDLVKALEREMKEEFKFVQNQWDGLVAGLQAHNYSMIINGIEITPDREGEILFSDPYYVTTEQLVVRKGEGHLNSLDALKGKRVGTLDGSLAHAILLERKDIETLPYDEENLAYEDLKLKRLDAVLLDEPIAIYYAQGDPELEFVGEPIGTIYYGIGINLKDKELLGRVNDALRKIGASGELKSILGSWRMWNKSTAQYYKQDPEYHGTAINWTKYASFGKKEMNLVARFERYVNYLPMLAKGALLTVMISVVAMVLAILNGLVLASIRIYGPWPLERLAKLWIEIVRGSPLLIQLYLIYYGLPHLGIQMPPTLAAVIGLGLNYGACEAENYRAGILSVPKTQIDAAESLGLSRRQSFFHIIMPQSLRLVIPPMTNDFIALLKDSSLVSVITMVELTTTYGQLASANFDYMGLGLLTALIYILIGLPFVRLSRYFEKRTQLLKPN